VIPDDHGTPRELGRYSGQEPGPLVICIGGMHGNEPAGVFAAGRVLGELSARNPRFHGRLIALSGNRLALARECRFVAEDLNRMWSSERLAALGSAASETALNPEEAQCRELYRAIETALAQHRGPTIFLDLHTASADGVPFAIVSDTLMNRKLAMSIAAPVILGLEEQLDGTMLDYINDRGFAAVGFEGGQHQEPGAVDHAEAALWAILIAAGCLREGEVERATSLRGVLRGRTIGIPAVVEVRYRHAITPDDQFRMEPGFVNFQPVKSGQLLAHDRSGEILAHETGRILMPLYQTQGSDGFFLVREISARWLKLSAVARRMHLERILHFLPGIHRITAHPDKLIVDPGVGSWLAVDHFICWAFGGGTQKVEKS
jgi:succinylglutamate desuccinylase